MIPGQKGDNAWQDDASGRLPSFSDAIENHVANSQQSKDWVENHIGQSKGWLETHVQRAREGFEDIVKE